MAEIQIQNVGDRISEQQIYETKLYPVTPGSRNGIATMTTVSPEKMNSVPYIVVNTDKSPEISVEHNYNMLEPKEVVSITPLQAAAIPSKNFNKISPDISKSHIITANSGNITPRKENVPLIVGTPLLQEDNLGRIKQQYVSPTFKCPGNNKKAQARVKHASEISRCIISGQSNQDSSNLLTNNNLIYPTYLRHHDDVIALIKTAVSDKRESLLYYQCNFCNYGINSAMNRQDIIKHVEVSHTIKCPWCDYTARTRSRIYHHHLEAHQDNKQFLSNRGLALAVKDGTAVYNEISLFSNSKPNVSHARSHNMVKSSQREEEAKSVEDLVTLIANGIDSVDPDNVAIDLPSQSDIEEADQLDEESAEIDVEGQTSAIAQNVEAQHEIQISRPNDTAVEDEVIGCHCCNVVLGSIMFYRIHLLVAHKLVVDDNGQQLFLVADNSIHKAILATQDSTRQSYASIPNLDIKLGLDRKEGFETTDELMQVARNNNLQQLVDIRELLIQWFKSIETQQSTTNTAVTETSQAQEQSADLHTLQNVQANQEDISQYSSPVDKSCTNKWECFYCPFTASENSEVVNHIVKDHPNSMIRIKQLFDDTDQGMTSQAVKKDQANDLKPLFCYYCQHMEYKMELLTDHIEAAHPGEKILATMSLPADDIATPQDTGTVDVVEVTNDIQQEEGVAIENGMAGWSSDNSESDSEVPEAIASLALAKEKLKKEKEKEQLLKDTLLEMETALNEESHRSSTRKPHVRHNSQLSDFLWSEEVDEAIQDSSMERAEVASKSNRILRRGDKKRRNRALPFIEPKQYKKRMPCRECVNCVRPECQKCDFCKDMTKFGGPGRLKQVCRLRKCLNPLQARRNRPTDPVALAKRKQFLKSVSRDTTAGLKKSVGRYRLNSSEEGADFVFEHEKSPFDTGKNFYQCPHCGRTGSVRQDLITHMTLGHPTLRLDKSEIKKFRKPASSHDTQPTRRGVKKVKTKRAVIKLVPLERFGHFNSLKEVFQAGEMERLSDELKRYNIKSLFDGTARLKRKYRRKRMPANVDRSSAVSDNRNDNSLRVKKSKASRANQEFIKRSTRRRRQNVANLQEMKFKVKMDQAEKNGLMKKLSVAYGPQALGMMETKYQCTRCPFITRTTSFMWNHLTFAHGESGNSGEPEKNVKMEDSESEWEEKPMTNEGYGSGPESANKSPKQWKQGVSCSPKQGMHVRAERTLDFEDI